MNCSVVIRAFNEAPHLGRLLEGIAQQTCRDVELILVDSGSTDSTVQIAGSYGAKLLHIRPEEFTFGRSLNIGMQAATRDLVVIASAHVYPFYPDWLECLLSPFSEPDIALVYGKQRGLPASAYSEQQIFRQWFPDSDIPRQQNPFCNNANAAIRRSLWQQHPYDESLTGLEDLAWARWAQSQGWGVSYVAHAEIVHVHAESLGSAYNRYRREGMAFKRIFPESHFSAYDFVRLTSSNILRDLRQAHTERVLWRNLGSVVWFRSAQFWGTYQGYRHASAVTQELRERFYYPPSERPRGAPVREVEPIRYNEPAASNERPINGKEDS